jgi:hypothetical protein
VQDSQELGELPTYTLGKYCDSDLSQKFPETLLDQSSLKDAVNQLNEACNDLDTIITDISVYVKWWSDRLRLPNANVSMTSTSLFPTEDRANEIILDKWRRIMAEFTTYIQEVHLYTKVPEV